MLSISVLNSAYAHTEIHVGDITIKTGWINEPPLVGELNAIVLEFKKEFNTSNCLGELFKLFFYSLICLSLKNESDRFPHLENFGLYLEYNFSFIDIKFLMHNESK